MNVFACLTVIAGCCALAVAAGPPGGPKRDFPRTMTPCKCLDQELKISPAQNKTMQECDQKTYEKMVALRKLSESTTAGTLLSTSASATREVRQGQGQWKGKGHGHGPHRPPMKFLACRSLCTGQAVGLFDAQGKPVSDDEASKVIKAVFPAEAAPKLIDAVKQCNSKFASDISNLTLDNCAGYRSIISCYNFETLQICDKEFILA